MSMNMGKSAAGLLGIAALSLSLVGQAQAITFSGALGDLSASADFTIQGGNLQIILTNTSSADVLIPADVLTGVFFTVPGAAGFTRESAVLTAGSLVHFDPDGQPAGGVVGGEWVYDTDLVGAPHGANSGISSAGLGVFGGNRFPGNNLAGAVGVNGLQYGILSDGDDETTGNAAVTGGHALIQNSVTFLLGNLGENFSLANISNVSLQYGTDLSEPNIRVPEPSTLLLMGAGLAGIGLWRRKSVNM